MSGLTDKQIESLTYIRFVCKKLEQLDEKLSLIKQEDNTVLLQEYQDENNRLSLHLLGLLKEETKTFFFGQYWQVYGRNSTEVPAHFTIEQAIAYVKVNWSDIGLAPDASYVQDSDEPDFENCTFSE